MTQQPDHYSAIRRRLSHMGLRLRLSDTLLFISRSLWVSTLLFFLILLAGRLMPIPYLMLWAVAPLVIWVLVVLGYLALRPLPAGRIARRVDSTLDLRERLATALELHNANTQDDISALQQQDAATVVQGLKARQLPLHFDRPIFLAGLVPLALGLALLVLPNPQDAILAERQQVEESLERAAEQLEDLREELARDETLTPEERARLETQLAELEAKLRQNPGNREEALADLSAAEARLQSELKPETDARRAALEQMARNMESLSGRQPAQRPDLNQAAEQLEQLARELENMTEEERQELADRLSEQAAQMAAGDPQTAQNLSDAAQSLRDGNTQQAAEQLQQAGESVREAQGEIADQQATQQALSEIQNSRSQIAQAGQQQQGQQGQQGQGQQGNQQGQPSGGGSNAPNLGQGQSNNPGNVDPNQPGSGQGNQQGGTVYQPYRPSGQQGDQEFIQGQQGEGGQTQSQQGDANLPGVNNPSVVPYEQVFPEYAESASEALDRGYIPPHLKDFVRDYFSQLEPGAQP